MPYVAIVPLRLMAGVPVKIHPLSARWDDLRLARGKGLHGQSHKWNDNPDCGQASGVPGDRFNLGRKHICALLPGLQLRG
jgi:hypothetical protein